MYTTKPDYINEKGVSWWRDHDLTKLATTPDVEGNSLFVTGYFIKEQNGGQAWVLVNGDSEIIEFEFTEEAIKRRISFRKEAQKHVKNFFLPLFLNRDEVI